MQGHSVCILKYIGICNARNSNFKLSSYTFRCKVLNFQTLESAAILFVYEVLPNLIDSPYISKLNLSTSGRILKTCDFLRLNSHRTITMVQPAEPITRICRELKISNLFDLNYIAVIYRT